MEGGEEVPGLFEVESAMIVVGGGDIDIGCGNAFGGAAEDEGADDSAQKENNVSGPSSFSYTVRALRKRWKSVVVGIDGSMGPSAPTRARGPASHIRTRARTCRVVSALSLTKLPHANMSPNHNQAMPFGSKGEFKSWIKDYVRNVRQTLKGNGVAQEEIKK